MENKSIYNLYLRDIKYQSVCKRNYSNRILYAVFLYCPYASCLPVAIGNKKKKK